eukprot:790908_1
MPTANPTTVMPTPKPTTPSPTQQSAYPTPSGDFDVTAMETNDGDEPDGTESTKDNQSWSVMVWMVIVAAILALIAALMYCKRVQNSKTKVPKDEDERMDNENASNDNYHYMTVMYDIAMDEKEPTSETGVTGSTADDEKEQDEIEEDDVFDEVNEEKQDLNGGMNADNEENMEIINANSMDVRARYKHAEVEQWLTREVGLSQYIDLFMEEGYDEMDVIVQTVTEQDLLEIGIKKRGHRKKILLFIDQLKNGIAAPAYGQNNGEEGINNL